MSFKMDRVVKLRRKANGEWFTCPLVTSTKFEVQIDYLDSDRWQAILDKSKKPGGKEFDGEKLARQIADTSITAWKGLNQAAMLELFPGLEPDQIAEIPEEGVPCDPETRFVLLKEHADFHKWVTTLTSERAVYVQQRKAAEQGN